MRTLWMVAVPIAFCGWFSAYAGQNDSSTASQQLSIANQGERAATFTSAPPSPTSIARSTVDRSGENTVSISGPPENWYSSPTPQPIPNPDRNVIFAQAADGLINLPPPIEEISKQIKSNHLSRVLLVGHTYNVSSKEYALALASKMTGIVEAMLLKLGVRTGQIRKLPLGHEERPKQVCIPTPCPKAVGRVELLVSE